MALKERTRTREVLFVQDDQTLVWHCHQVPITEILQDGVIVAAKYGNAESLTIEGAGQVLDAALVSIAAENDVFRGRIKALEQQLDELRAAAPPHAPAPPLTPPETMQ